MAPSRGVTEIVPAEESSPITAVKAKKQPPLEKASQRWLRNVVVLSFWGLIAIIGLPMWLKTTSTYRVELPEQEMEQWAAGLKCNLNAPLIYSIQGDNGGAEEWGSLARLLRDFARDRTSSHGHDPRVQSSETEEIALEVMLDSGDIGEKAVVAQLDETKALLRLKMPEHNRIGGDAFLYRIQQETECLFQREVQMFDHILSTAKGPAGDNARRRIEQQKAQNPGLEATLSHAADLALPYSPHHHLTFSLFTPTALPSSWEISPAIETYLSPLLRQLSTLSTFSTSSQIQLHSPFSPSITPEYNAHLNAWTIPPSSLPSFINAAEWPLNPSTGLVPTTHFIAYIPHPSHSPLLIAPANATSLIRTSQSFLLPQFGAITILNPPPNTSYRHLYAPALEPALSDFATHLLTLLAHPPASPHTNLPLRLATPRRLAPVTLLISASETLGSLAALLRQLPNIPIPAQVAASVRTALEALDGACGALERGEYGQALHMGQVAERESKRAFFEKSMLGQVYFPDEHKVAVYLPLLGPVGVPLVVALVKVLRAEGAGLRGWMKGRLGR